MKKFAVILLSLMLTASLAACGKNEKANNSTAAAAANSSSNANVETAANTDTAKETEVPTAKELIQKVTEAGNSMKSFSMVSTIDEDISMTANGQEQKQNISIKTTQDMVKEPFAIYQELESNMPEEQGGGTIKQYFTKDAIYTTVDSDGNWVKLPDDSAAPLLEEVKNAGSPEQQFKQFESIADQIEITDEGDVYLLKANLSGNGVKDLAKSFLMQNEGANADTEQLLEQMDIKSINMSYTVDKKTYYPVDVNVDMVMGMDIEGQSVSMDMKMKSKISKVNEVEVKVPDDVINSAS